MTGPGMIHIVDDEEAIRDALCFLFTSRGVDSRGWPSGAAFLAAQPLADCACIILDVRMPDLSGPETFQRLRALGNTAPVIFLTGHADVPVAVQALKAGAYDFLEKPFSPAAFIAPEISCSTLRFEIRSLRIRVINTAFSLGESPSMVLRLRRYSCSASTQASFR